MGTAKDRIIFKVDVPANRHLAKCDATLGVDGAPHSTAMLGVQERRPINQHSFTNTLGMCFPINISILVEFLAFH